MTEKSLPAAGGGLWNLWGPWKITLEPGTWWAHALWWWLLLYHDIDSEILAPIALRKFEKAAGLCQGREKKKKKKKNGLSKVAPISCMSISYK